MPTSVRVQVFGRFNARLETGEALAFRTSRAAELVARLVLQRTGRLPRAELAQDLWPDTDRSAQLRNLRPALSYARSALGDDLIQQVDDDTLILNSVESDWEDAIRRERIALGSLSNEERINALLRLAHQIQKPLLAGWDGEWIAPYRDFHERRRLNVLRILAEEFGARGDWEAGLESATQILEIDPLSEQGIRLTLRFLGQLGRTAEGVQVFKTYRVRLQEELGLKVSSNLRDYARSILSQQAESESRPLTSLQQEFIQSLFLNLLETDPGRLMTLLASPSVNWEVVRHGPELLPLLEQALAHSKGWNEDRAGVIKRLLMCYSQFSNWAGVKKYSDELYAKGSLNDKIAALNYRGIHCAVAGQYEDAFAAYDEATVLAIESGQHYYRSVTACNRARLLSVTGEAEEALPIIEAEYESLSQDQTMAGRYASARHMFLLLEATIFAGRLKEARKLLEKIHVYVEANWLGRDFEERDTLTAFLTLDDDPSSAREIFCRGIESVLANRVGNSAWVGTACFAINGLSRLGNQAAAERLAQTLRVSAEASGLVIAPALLSLLPAQIGRPKTVALSGSDLLLEIHDELRGL